MKDIKKFDWRDVIGWVLLALAVILLIFWFIKGG